MKTCALFRGNFLGISLNIVSIILLQSEITAQSTYFSPVHIFAKNLHYAYFELNVILGYVGTEHLLRLYGIGKVPMLK